METLEEQLRRQLQRLSPPGDPSGVVDRVLRKAARRHARRGAGIVLLTFIVIAGSIGGFLALSRVFGRNEPANVATPVRTNGLIVFSDIRISGYDDEGANVLDDWHLYTVDPVDGQVTRIGPDSVGEALYPTWSPDGSRIAFVGFVDVAEELPRGSIYVADADGTNAKALFTTGEAEQIEGLRWSPDGSRIGYELADFGSDGSPIGDWSWTIWTMAPDGTDRQQVTTTGREMHFSWSPDGTQVVFERFEPIQDQSQLGEAAADLFIIDADGGGEVRLTDDGVSRDPAWSPDGSQIALSHGPRGDQHVAVMLADGSGLREMAARAEAGTFFPYGNTVEWSPDGETIAFSGHSLDDVCFISLLDIDAGNVRRLVSSPAAEGCPGQEGMSWAVAVDEGERESESPMPSPAEDTPPDGIMDLGLGFPVCNVTSVSGTFTPGVNGKAFVATKTGDTGGCPKSGAGFQVLAVDVSGDGLADASHGPLDCDDFCSAFAAPDVDGDGIAEVAVAVGSTGGSTLFELYAVAGGATLQRLGYDCSQCNDGTFAWGRPGGHAEGSYCLPESGVGDFVAWNAERTDAGDEYALVEVFIDVKGGFLSEVDQRDSRVPFDNSALPPGGGNDFCGAPVALG